VKRTTKGSKRHPRLDRINASQAESPTNFLLIA
jgi:hypothetical protein